MVSLKRYAVIGTGAIGGYYGSMLYRAGADVHFLFHSDYDYVREHGLRINSWKGDFHFDRVNAYRDAADMPKADVVIVGLKTVNEVLLKDLLPPLLKEDTIVVLIQNGIGVESDVAAMLPRVQLVAGLAFICSTKRRPGVVDHEHFGHINLASFSVRDAAGFHAVVADFQSAGIETYEVEYEEARWKKAVWNMPFNGMSVVLNTQTDKLLADEKSEQMIHDLMMEVVNAAKALKVNNVDERFVRLMIDTTKNMIPYSPSMKVDYDCNRPMEIEYLYSKPIAMARRAGYRMEKMEMLEAQLRFLDAYR